MERRRELLVGLLVLVVLVLLGMNSTRFFTRVDLTEDRRFTISPVSRRLFRELPDRVHITYFVSERLRSVTPVPNRIIDLLREYASYSHGRIIVTVEDPARGAARAAVERLGIPPQQIQVIEQSEQRVAEVYSGLLIQYLDRQIAIPFVFNPDSLEYSLTLTIRRIVRNSSSVVGVLIGDVSKSLDRDYSMLNGQLSLSFTVRSVRAGEEIPPDVSVLLVLGGSDYSREQLAPIDRYLMGGGRVLFGVKGVRVETRRSLSASAIGNAPLLDMLAGYGVEVGREMVLDESSRDYRLPQVVFGQVKWQVIGRYPEWVSISPRQVSDTNPITRRFSGLDLLWPSPLTLAPPAQVAGEPLFRSSPRSWLARSPFTTDPFKLVGVTAPKASAGGYLLGAVLTGRFPSFFPSGPERRSPDTRIIVIGDDDFASDLMQFSDSPSNALFLENAVEWLSSDSDLLAIKTRVTGDLRLDRITDPTLRAARIRFAELLNVVVLPFVVLLAGFLRLFLRQEQRMAARRGRGGQVR